ncbi:MAG: creatininase family protein [Candidatus Riflebacteria bacterium]|nr:creatininase family protein [Candidatus Riflebacteria bacterium]NLV92961.1 creatininase family protein [Candidatus Riflebacteria bacterium]
MVQRKPRYLKYMNTIQTESVLKENAPLFIPIGTLEAHGRHLPISTDTICAEKIAEKLCIEVGGVIAPPIEYGLTNVFLQTAPGSFFPEDVFKSYVEHIVRNFRKHGFKTIIIVNGHGGNRDSLKQIIRTIPREEAIALSVINWWILAEKYVERVYGCKPGGHAAVEETAAMLNFYPTLVSPAKYSPNIDDYVPEESLWMYPPPGEVLLQEEGEGRPSFDSDKAEMFISLIISDLSAKIKRWLNSFNRIKGSLRP